MVAWLASAGGPSLDQRRAPLNPASAARVFGEPSANISPAESSCNTSCSFCMTSPLTRKQSVKFPLHSAINRSSRFSIGGNIGRLAISLCNTLRSCSALPILPRIRSRLDVSDIAIPPHLAEGLLWELERGVMLCPGPRWIHPDVAHETSKQARQTADCRIPL